jgi:hypothetical protein
MFTIRITVSAMCLTSAVPLAENRDSLRSMAEFSRGRVERLFPQEPMLSDYQALFTAVLDGEFNGLGAAGSCCIFPH